MAFQKRTLDQAKPSAQQLVNKVREIMRENQYLPPLLEIGTPLDYKTRQAVSRVLGWWLEPEEFEQMKAKRLKQADEARQKLRQAKPKKQRDHKAAVATVKQIYGNDYYRRMGAIGGHARGVSPNIHHPQKATSTTPLDPVIVS